MTTIGVFWGCEGLRHWGCSIGRRNRSDRKVKSNDQVELALRCDADTSGECVVKGPRWLTGGRHRAAGPGKKSVLRKIFAAATTVGLLATVAVAGSSVAMADGQGPGHSSFAPYLNTWGGQAVKSYCVDNERAEPLDSQNYTSSVISAWSSSWMLNNYDHVNDATTNAALAYLMHVAPDIPHDDKSPVEFGYATPAENAKIAEIRAGAAANAGPYTANAVLTQNAALSGGNAAVGVASAAGNYQAGLAFTAELIGTGAVWAANGTQSYSGTTTSSLLDLAVTATSSGAVTVMVTFQGLNAGQVTYWSPRPGSGYQHTASINPTVAPAVATASFDHPFAVEFQPVVTTQTSSAIAREGDALSDTLVVSVADGGTWIGGPLTATSTLYGPFQTAPAQSATPPAGAPVVGTVTTSVTGAGTFTTPTLVLSAEGFYVWHESIPAGDWNLPWTAPFGVVQETTVVKWTPEVTTRTSVTEGEIGTELADELTVTGVRDGSTLPVVSTLWGPFLEAPELSATIPADAPKVGEVTTTVGNGEHTTPTLVLPASGFYVWTETIAADDAHNGWSSQFGITEETTIVKWTPEVNTVTSQAIAEEGTELTDTLNVVGVHPDHDVTINSTLYGPFVDRPAQSDAPAADAPVVGTVKTVVRGPGQYVTPALVLPSGGWYVWYETIPGDDFHNPWQPPTFPLEPETTLVKWSPKVTTKTSVQKAEVGTALADTVGAEGKPGATVKVESTLWGPFLDRPPLIKREGGNVVKGWKDEVFTPVIEANPAAGAARAVGTVTTEIVLGADGTGTAASPTIVLTAAGYYVWTEYVLETPETNGWQSDFGISEETTVVPWEPKVATVISDMNAVKGGFLTDTVYVEGLKPNNGQPAAAWDTTAQPVKPPVEAWDGKDLTLPSPTPPADFGQNTADPLTITINLWGPLAKKPVAGDLRPADAIKLGTVTIAARNGVQISPEVGPLPGPGWYVFQEYITPTDSTKEHEGPWFAVTETAFVPTPETPPAPAGNVEGGAVKGTLAKTGASSSTPWLVGSGLVILLLGTGMVLAVRRANSDTAIQ